MGVAGRLTARHRQVMRLVVRPLGDQAREASPRMRATTAAVSGFLATTVRQTPPGMVSIRADQSGMPSSSAACDTTIAPMARSVRAAPVISMARPPGTGTGLTAARSTTFVHVDEMLTQPLDVGLGPVRGGIGLEDLDDLRDGANRVLPGHRLPAPAILRIISMCSACLSGPGAPGESC